MAEDIAIFLWAHAVAKGQNNSNRLGRDSSGVDLCGEAGQTLISGEQRDQWPANGLA